MRYGAILADVPWRFVTWSAKGRGRSPDGLKGGKERHYATMPLGSIKALPVLDMAADDCALFLWATDPLLPRALEVGAAWGFAFKTVAFYWVKARRDIDLSEVESLDGLFPMGNGYWTRANPEQCLLFTRGSPQRLSASVRRLIISPRREHSRKPDEIYGRVEALVGGPYLEMFARQKWPGWDSWGDEVGKFIAAPARKVA